jgi:hypothetical protein
MRNIILAGFLALAALPAGAANLEKNGVVVGSPFSELPAAKDWATKTVGSKSDSFKIPAELDKGFQKNFDATTGLAALKPATTTNNHPAAVFRSPLAALQSRTTGTAYAVIVARVVNRTGAPISRLKLEYDQETLPDIGKPEHITGFRVFFSTTGLPGSWTLIPGLSGIDSASQDLVETLQPADFADGKTLYVAWADDNDSGASDDEKAYTLANVRWTAESDDSAAVKTTAPAPTDVSSPTTDATNTTETIAPAQASSGVTTSVIVGAAALIAAGGAAFFLIKGKKKPAAIPRPSGKSVPLPPPPGH